MISQIKNLRKQHKEDAPVIAKLEAKADTQDTQIGDMADSISTYQAPIKDPTVSLLASTVLRAGAAAEKGSDTVDDQMLNSPEDMAMEGMNAAQAPLEHAIVKAEAAVEAADVVQQKKDAKALTNEVDFAVKKDTMASLDTNHDGYLDAGELRAALGEVMPMVHMLERDKLLLAEKKPMQALFTLFDANKVGVLWVVGR